MTSRYSTRVGVGVDSPGGNSDIASAAAASACVDGGTDLPNLCTTPGPWPLCPHPKFAAILSDPSYLKVDLAKRVPFFAAARESANVETPNWNWLVKWSGTDGTRRCYRIYAAIAIMCTQGFYGVVLALAFYGFGVPLPVAIGLGAPYFFLAYVNVVMFFDTINTRTFVALFSVCARQFDDAARNAIRGTVMQQVILSVVNGFLIWYGMGPLVAGDSPVLAHLCVGTVALYTVALLNPPMTIIGATANTLLSVSPSATKSMIDSYAHSLVSVLMSEDLDKRTKLATIDVMHRNFIRLLSVRSRPHRANTAHFLAYLGLALGCSAAVLCVVIVVPGETSANMNGRVGVGIFNALLLGAYLIQFVNNAVSQSRRWDHVSRAHLMTPRVTQKALELGAWSTVPGFKAWLREDHELGEYIFGVLVDHRRASQLAAALGSSVAAVLGYGVLSLTGFG